MNHRNKVNVCISIHGDSFDPEELTKLLQLQPTHTHIKGHEIPLQPGLQKMPCAPKPKYKETTWEYGSGYINTYDSEDASQILENAIKDKIELVNDFVQKHDLDVKICLIAYLDKRRKRFVLGIGFSSSFIKMVADLNTEIEIDMHWAPLRTLLCTGLKN